MITDKDIKVLTEMLALLKKIEHKYGLLYDILYEINKEKFPKRLIDNRPVKNEFERLSDFFIKTEFADLFEHPRFGMSLLPRDKIIDCNINSTYKLYKKKTKKNTRFFEFIDKSTKLINFIKALYIIIFFVLTLILFYLVN